MAPTAMLTEDGRRLKDKIIERSERSIFDTYWLARATELGCKTEFARLCEEQGDFANWIKFGKGFSLGTYKNFRSGKRIRWHLAQTFCDVFDAEFEDMDFKIHQVTQSDPDPLFPLMPKEMEALKKSAFERLIADSQDIDHCIRAYGNALSTKNMDFLGDKDFEVSLKDLTISAGEPAEGVLDQHNPIVQFELLAHVEGILVQWGFVFVNEETGRAELLLEPRTYWIGGRHLIIAGEQYRRLRLTDGSFTRWALDSGEKAFCRYTEGRKRIVSWPGFLKDKNLKVFRDNYRKYQQDYSEEYDLMGRCLRETSFGNHRIKRGTKLMDLRVIDRDIFGVPNKVMVLDARREGAENWQEMQERVSKAENPQEAYLFRYDQ